MLCNVVVAFELWVVFAGVDATGVVKLLLLVDATVTFAAAAVVMFWVDMFCAVVALLSELLLIVELKVLLNVPGGVAVGAAVKFPPVPKPAAPVHCGGCKKPLQ